MDPDQQRALHILSSIVPLIVLVITAYVGFTIFLLWRIYSKAGLAGPLSLLFLVPFGRIIVLAILAFSDWKVIPAPTASPYYLPSYPPPPTAPPSYQPPPAA